MSATVPTTVRQFIGGRDVDGTSGETFPTVNPATGEVLAQVQQASADDVDAAVASSRQAFEEWRETPGAARGRVLMEVARLLRARNDELAAELAATREALRQALAAARSSSPNKLPVLRGPDPGQSLMVWRRSR